MPKQHQGPIWVLLQHKAYNKCAREKFVNLKWHDCHVIMTQLLLVALRGIIPPHVRLATVKLCAFLNAISQKAINPLDLATLQNDVFNVLSALSWCFLHLSLIS